MNTKFTKFMFRRLALLALLTGSVWTAQAQKTFNVASGGWNTAGNWSPAGVPAVGDPVIIPIGRVCTLNVALTGALARTANITVESGGTFVVGDGLLTTAPICTLNASSTLAVQSGGTIVFNNRNNTGVAFTANPICYHVSGAGTFDLQAGATMEIRHNQGITSSGNTGCVWTTTRNYSGAANYIYSHPGWRDGQALGNALGASGAGTTGPITGSVTIKTGDVQTSAATVNVNVIGGHIDAINGSFAGPAGSGYPPNRTGYPVVLMASGGQLGTGTITTNSSGQVTAVSVNRNGFGYASGGGTIGTPSVVSVTIETNPNDVRTHRIANSAWPEQIEAFASGNITVNTPGTFTVQNHRILDMGLFNINGTGSFAMNNNSCLKTADPDGIDNINGPVVCSTINYNVANTSFQLDATTGTPVTGNDFPATVRDVIVTGGNIILTNPFSVTRYIATIRCSTGTGNVLSNSGRIQQPSGVRVTLANGATWLRNNGASRPVDATGNAFGSGSAPIYAPGGSFTFVYGGQTTSGFAINGELAFAPVGTNYKVIVNTNGAQQLQVNTVNTKTTFTLTGGLSVLGSGLQIGTGATGNIVEWVINGPINWLVNGTGINVPAFPSQIVLPSTLRIGGSGAINLVGGGTNCFLGHNAGRTFTEIAINRAGNNIPLGNASTLTVYKLTTTAGSFTVQGGANVRFEGTAFGGQANVTTDGAGTIVSIGAITTPGEGYYVGQQVNICFNSLSALATVASVNGTGGITSLTLNSGGSGYSAGSTFVAAFRPLLTGIGDGTVSTVSSTTNLNTTAGASRGNLQIVGRSASWELPATVYTNGITNLTVDALNGVTLNENLDINGTLSLTKGALKITNNKILTYSSASITRSQGYISMIGAGNIFRWNFPSAVVGGTTYEFPVGPNGTVSGYRPLRYRPTTSGTGNPVFRFSFLNTGSGVSDLTNLATPANNRTNFIAVVNTQLSPSVAAVPIGQLSMEANLSTDFNGAIPTATSIGIYRAQVPSPWARIGNSGNAVNGSNTRIFKTGYLFNYTEDNNFVLGQTGPDLLPGTLADRTWEGDVSTDFFDPANWVSDLAPADITESAIIGTPVTFQPSISNAEVAGLNNIQVNDGGILTIGPSAEVILNGSFDISGTGSATANATSTVRYSGITSANVAALSYGTLDLSSSAVATRTVSPSPVTTALSVGTRLILSSGNVVSGYSSFTLSSGATVEYRSGASSASPIGGSALTFGANTSLVYENNAAFDLTLGGETPANTGTGSLTVTGTNAGNGVVIPGGKSLTVGGATSITSSFLTLGNATPGVSALTFTGTITTGVLEGRLQGGPAGGSTNNLTINSATVTNTLLNGGVFNDFTLGGAATVAAETGTTLTVNGTLTRTAGTLNLSNSNLVLNGTTSPSPITTGFTLNAVSNLTIGGTSAFQIPSTVGTINNLTVSNTNASPPLMNSNITVAGILDIQGAAQLRVGDGTVARSLVMNVITPGSSAKLVTFPNTTGSSLTFGGTSTQIVSGYNLNNLTLASTGGATITGSVTVATGFTNTAGSTATMNAGVNINPFAAGFNFTNNGIFTPSTTSTIGVGTGNFSNSGTFNQNGASITVGGTFTNNGTYNIGNGDVLNLNGTVANSISTGSGSVFNPAQNDPALSINLTGAATVSNSGTFNCGNSASITLNSTGGFTNNLTGIFRYGGTFTVAGATSSFGNVGTLDAPTGTLAFTGGAGTNTFSFNKPTNLEILTINKSGGGIVQLTGPSTLTINNTLNVLGGTLNAGGQRVILRATASQTARVAQITGTLSNATNFTYQQYFPSTTDGWYFLGTPILGQSLSNWGDNFDIKVPFTGSNLTQIGEQHSTVYTYDGNITPDGSGVNEQAGWRVITANSVNAGQGYRTYLSGRMVTTGSKIFDNTGTLVQGNFSFPTIGFNPIGYNGGGWTLSANPYPSNVDWDAVGWTRTNVDGAYYLWNGVAGQYGSYVSGVGTPGAWMTNVIPSGQGFFVRANAASPVFSASESVKTAATKSFVRTATAQELFRIRLSSSLGQNDEMVVYFRPESTDGFDSQYDAYKLNSNGINFSSFSSEGSNLSINSLAPVTENKTVQVNVAVPANGTYVIEAFEIPANGPKMYLKDNFMGNFHEFATEGNYTFQVTSDPASRGASRFELVFTTQSISSVGQNLNRIFDLYPNPSSGESVTVRISNFAGTEGRIVITDVLGRNVFNQDVSLMNGTFVGELGKNLSPGAYNVEFRTANQVEVKRLLVK